MLSDRAKAKASAPKWPVVQPSIPQGSSNATHYHRYVASHPPPGQKRAAAAQKRSVSANPIDARVAAKATERAELKKAADQKKKAAQEKAQQTAAAATAADERLAAERVAAERAASGKK